MEEEASTRLRELGRELAQIAVNLHEHNLLSTEYLDAFWIAAPKIDEIRVIYTREGQSEKLEAQDHPMTDLDEPVVHAYIDEFDRLREPEPDVPFPGA